MIKIGTFEFHPFESKNHWVDFAIFGELECSNVEHFERYSAVTLRLDPEDTWQIALDQSTTNSGIFIKNYENTKAYMIEFSRDRGEQADDYIYDLEMLLHKISEGARYTHLIYERPIKSESFRSAEVLFQLEGMLRALVRRYEEFRTAQLDYIENSSWRAVVVDSDKFSGYDRKRQTVKSIEAIYPWTKAYGGSIGSDQDIYEAIGVMFGWFINSYDKLGRPYVKGDKYTGSIGGYILPFQSAEEVASEFEKLGIEATWRIEHPRKSIYENIAAGLEHYKVKCVEISDPVAMLALTIECNMKWMNPDKMTVVLVAANFVDKRLFQVTGKEYHFVF